LQRPDHDGRIGRFDPNTFVAVGSAGMKLHPRAGNTELLRNKSQ
jgi:hypothetical protein